MFWYWMRGAQAAQAFWMASFTTMLSAGTRAPRTAETAPTEAPPGQNQHRTQRWVRTEMHALPVTSREAKAALAEVERMLKAEK